MRWWNWMMAALAFAGMWAQGAMAVEHNEKLADVMNLLSDQSSGIGEVSRAVPAEVTARTFARAISRARAGQWLLAELGKQAGKVVDGKLEAAELTPGKMKEVTAGALEDLAKQYADLLTNASAKFVAAEAALKKQAALDAAKRDFTDLKAVVKDIGTAMTAGHKIFKP